MTRTISQPYPSTLLEVRKFTYRELLEMERVGIIQEDQHVELLGGHLVVMTIHPPHAAAVVTTQPGTSGTRGVPEKTLWRAVMTL